MNAKNSDLARIQEIWDLTKQTQMQMANLNFTEDRFLNPNNDNDDLIAEGLMNRVFRIVEEAGHISDEVASKYSFERRAASGVRNRLAHAYGEVDKAIIWQVISVDLNELASACARFASDIGISLE